MALLTAVCSIFVVFTACPGLLSDEKQIFSFSFTSPAAVGVINESAKTIAITVPAGTNVTALVPSITISATATVSPASGVAMNFTNPVKYTITAEDGSAAEYIVTVSEGASSLEPIELISPITVNTTLKDLGLPVDYVFKANDFLVVKDNAILTIEPGVTIQFTEIRKGGGLHITAGATIKAEGTESKHIQFTGATSEPGSWYGIYIDSKTDNTFTYCDFLNIGSEARTDKGGFQLYSAKAGFSHCKFTNGLGYGLRAVWNPCEISAFDNNVFEGFENYPPVLFRADNSMNLLEKFDMTSDFTNNAYAYIEIWPRMPKAAIINQTTVPYYFYQELELSYQLTINEGVTIYMERSISGTSGRLIVNGTVDKKVKFTRMPGSSDYWNYISFYSGLRGSVINNCIIEYGGNSSPTPGNILIADATELTLNNVELNNSLTHGAYIRHCEYTLNHTNVTFSNNTEGNVWDDCCSQVLPEFP